MNHALRWRIDRSRPLEGHPPCCARWGEPSLGARFSPLGRICPAHARVASSSPSGSRPGLRIPEPSNPISILPGACACLPDFRGRFNPDFGASLVADLCRNHHLLMWRAKPMRPATSAMHFLRKLRPTRKFVGTKSIPSPAEERAGFLDPGVRPPSIPATVMAAEEIYIPLRGHGTMGAE